MNVWSGVYIPADTNNPLPNDVYNVYQLLMKMTGRESAISIPNDIWYAYKQALGIDLTSNQAHCKDLSEKTKLPFESIYLIDSKKIRNGIIETGRRTVLCIQCSKLYFDTSISEDDIFFILAIIYDISKEIFQRNPLWNKCNGSDDGDLQSNILHSIPIYLAFKLVLDVYSATPSKLAVDRFEQYIGCGHLPDNLADQINSIKDTSSSFYPNTIYGITTNHGKTMV